MENEERLGVRRFLKRHWHLLVFTIVHALFSLYIRIRQAYHQVVNKVSSVYHHHHRAPDLIYNDVKDLRRLPKHLSVILTLDEDARGGTGLAKLIEEASDVAAWCASARIPQLSIYEKTGTWILNMGCHPNPIPEEEERLLTCLPPHRNIEELSSSRSQIHDTKACCILRTKHSRHWY